MTVIAHNFNDYRDEVLEDIKAFIDDQGQWYVENGYDFDGFYEDLWTNDSVTGNGSGSYYFNTAKARTAVSEFVFSDEFKEMCDEWGIDAAKLLADGPEAVDVSVRCYVLGFVRDDAEQYWDERFGGEE